ncbi:MAG: nucleotidyl transferase AbiEii/AbiGii toxin family protein [Cyanobacteria bacterium SID2]|nr:nucleotidyl transferase AbiEii/AbiGii toxin family protein [Cyanobacteria bacterium SID2]
MLSADALSFQEFMNRETLPLAILHGAILETLQGRRDVVLFGAQAVNAYVGEPRMTQDIDVIATDAAVLAEELKAFLIDRFLIAVRVRVVKGGMGYRLDRGQKGGNRHLMDIRQVEVLPESQEIEGIQVMAPVELVASKVVAYFRRRGKPKAGTDWRDLAMLLLRFPELKVERGVVWERLVEMEVDEGVFELWREVVGTAIEVEDEDDDF